MPSNPTLPPALVCRVFAVAFFLLLLVPLRGQTLDSGLNAGANAEVFTVALQPDGKILVGGNFTTIGGVERQRIARFNADGTLDATFNPGANSSVRVIRVQDDGRILVGGQFTAIGGATRLRLARLHPNGAVDATVALGADGGVRDFAVQSDGRIVVVGTFTTLAGAPRTGIGRLNPDGTLDAAFNPVVAGTNTPAALFIDAVTRLPNGQLLIGGNFATVNNQSSAGAARLNVDGTRDPAFTPAATSDVLTFAVLPDGKFLVGGSFSQIGGQPRRYLARFNANGSLDPTVPAVPNSAVRDIAVQADGRIVIVGHFTEMGPVRRMHIARLNSDLSLDAQFFPDVSGSVGTSSPGVYSVALSATSQIIIGGAFSSVAGTQRSGVARFGSPLPVIITAPRDVYVPLNSSATFTVGATGESLRYQWSRNGVDITGATNATLHLPVIEDAQAGTYTVAVSNLLGTVMSAPARLVIGTPPATIYTVTTVAGTAGLTGLRQATGPDARFNQPLGIAVGTGGTLFVMDGPNNVIREIQPHGFAGILSGIAGWGLAVDAAGNIYVADADARIARVTRAGAVSNFAGTPGIRGSSDGPATTAQFRMPRGVTVDRAGNVFVADSDNYTIRKITPDGVVSTLAGLAGVSGLTDGAGSAARFHWPWSIAADDSGNLFVADRTAVRKVTPEGVVTTIAAAGSVGDAIGIAVDGAGNVFITDVAGHTVRRVAPTGEVSVIAGQPGLSGSADGAGNAARFSSPWNLAVDAAGTLFVTDNGNSTIRKISPDASPLFINAGPTAQHTTAGAPATLTVAASGTSLQYQWRKDGVTIGDATNASYTVSAASANDMGFYTVVVSSAGSATESVPTVLTVSTPGSSGRLINVATRGFIQPGEALTPGFVLRGSGAKNLIVRGIGPGLLNFGLGGSLANPALTLTAFDGTPMLSNDDWPAAVGAASLPAAFNAVGAFPLQANSRDAAAFAPVTTTVDRAYTVRISATDATSSGIALAEVYDADPLSSPVQLANVSTRGFVGTGANALVPGFVIGGDGPLQLLIRAVGPGLAPFGVANVLADPQLTVVPLGRNFTLAANDNWGGSSTLSAAFAAAGAFSLPLGSRDAAVLVRLPPGGYTVVVSGVGGTTGTALVEIYDVP